MEDDKVPVPSAEVKPKKVLKIDSPAGIPVKTLISVNGSPISDIYKFKIALYMDGRDDSTKAVANMFLKDGNMMTNEFKIKSLMIELEE